MPRNVQPIQNHPIQIRRTWKMLKVNVASCSTNAHCKYRIRFKSFFFNCLCTAEHISLEEISSDSNDELNKPKKSKKHSSKSTKKIETPAEASKTVTSAKSTDANANGKAGKLFIMFHFWCTRKLICFFFWTTLAGEKQYSILELLELQARARAIRSQLALEPVTKIELDDSEDETAKNIKEPEPKQRAKKISTSDKNETPKDVSGLASSSTGNEEINEPAKPTSESTEQTRVPSSRPIRLKRNFRPRHFDEEEISASDLKRTENAAEESVEKSPVQLPERIEEKADDKEAASVKLDPFEIWIEI